MHGFLDYALELLRGKNVLLQIEGLSHQEPSVRHSPSLRNLLLPEDASNPTSSKVPHRLPKKSTGTLALLCAEPP